jgi:HD superfamily phosphohydrolase
MLAAIERNSGCQLDDQTRQDTILAGLLHDLGHGPFSHTLEEILGGRKQFDEFRFYGPA